MIQRIASVVGQQNRRSIFSPANAMIQEKASGKSSLTLLQASSVVLLFQNVTDEKVQQKQKIHHRRNRPRLLRHGHGLRLRLRLRLRLLRPTLSNLRYVLLRLPDQPISLFYSSSVAAIFLAFLRLPTERTDSYCSKFPTLYNFSSDF